jgi:lysophospholipase L1-like esterase
MPPDHANSGQAVRQYTQLIPLSFGHPVNGQSRTAGTAARLLALAGAVVLSILAAEIVLRWTGRIPIPPTRVTTQRPGLYQEYKPYGYRLWPSRTTTYLYPKEHPRLLTVTSNRYGFRGRRELDEPDARPRVVVLGDSMVFGEGVEEPERFTEQLEAEERKWRVDNLGMTGFGPDLMLRALEQVGLQLHPAVVVLTIYTDDLRRVRPEYAGAGFEIPRFVLRSGHLVSIDYPLPRLWMRSSIVAATREVIWRTSGTEWRLNAAILDRFREHAQRAAFKLVLIFLPGTSDTPKDYERRTWLRAYAERTGTTFLDLTDPILGRRSESLFIPNNWHLNAQGHRVVAESIRRLLETGVPAPAG